MTYGTMDVNPNPQMLLGTRQNRSTSRISKSRFPENTVLRTLVSKDPKSVTLATGVTNRSRTKSFVYTMLNPRSVARQAIAYKWFITSVIVLDLIAFIMSTDLDLNPAHAQIYVVWEAIDSWIFLLEYILRLITVTESVKYGSMGPIRGRLKYMRTYPALVDLAATLPYFLEKFSGYNLPTLTYLRSFRLLRILKTHGFTEAIKSVCRVFRYNSEILYVALWIGMGLVLCTAVLMYYLRPRDMDHDQFKSLPATIFLATMMLTGQGGPDGELPWYTSSVVVLTGVFSIGMFAIPASMLTWGFEGEAERLAKLRWKRTIGKENSGDQLTADDRNDDWSYSSDDYSTDEEYLNTIAGLDEDDSDDEEGKAKQVFHLADTDGDGSISLSEFIRLSRLSAPPKGNPNNTALEHSQITFKRLQELEKRVAENSEKLDRICAILEGRRVPST